MSSTKKKRKLSIQKIFNLVSFTFILACCIFYGSRFIKLYLENNKKETINTLASTIINNNQKSDNFKNINNTYYFYKDTKSNYLRFSNITWRIIKIASDNSITLVTDNSITSLANKEKTNFDNSYIKSWLNSSDKEYSGILENNLNNPNKYLTYTNTCNDKINDTKKITCNNKTDELYITTPSLNDYINTGAKDSFMNNEEYFYLINNNDDNKIWYVDNNGKLNTSDGTDILGIKAIITIKNTTPYKEGDGTVDNPYIIEDESSLFGSYVKLDNDTWRIYSINENSIKLSLNSYLTINNEEITQSYSNTGYKHNDTKSGTLAYYLKNTYLPKLKYNNIIKEGTYSNGIYGASNNYDYSKTLKSTVPTKVATLSIGDIFLNSKLTNYYTSTGPTENSSLVYVMQNNFKIYTKEANSKLKIVPVIEIDKNLLTKGNGTIDSPFEME